MPRPKTHSPWRPHLVKQLLPPLLVLLAGSSLLPLADAAPRPTAAPVRGHNATEPCRPRPHVDPARGKAAAGGTTGPPCGFYDGDPARPLIPPPGMGCTANEATRTWGFCPARAGGSFMDPGSLHRSNARFSSSSSSSCRLTTTCYDAFACKEGCGVSFGGGAVGEEAAAGAVDDEAVHAVDEETAGWGQDGDEDEDEDGDGMTRHPARVSGRALARIMCSQHDASKYCNMALWIRRDGVRFTSVTCGTAAGSTTSIYESPRTTAAPTTTAAAARGPGGAPSGTWRPSPSFPLPSSGGRAGGSTPGWSSVTTTRGQAAVTSGASLGSPSWVPRTTASPVVGKSSGGTDADATSSRAGGSSSSRSGGKGNTSRGGDSGGSADEALPSPAPPTGLVSSRIVVAPTTQTPAVLPTAWSTRSAHTTEATRVSSLPPADPSITEPAAAPTASASSHPPPPPPPPADTPSTGGSDASAAMTTTTPRPDSDRDAPAEHGGDRGRVAGIIVGALAGVVLAAAAVLFAAYSRTRDRFGTAMQFIYHSFKSSTSSGGFGAREDHGRPHGEQKWTDMS